MGHLDTTTFILCTVPLVLLCAWVWYSNVRIATLEAENELLDLKLQNANDTIARLSTQHSLD